MEILSPFYSWSSTPRCKRLQQLPLLALEDTCHKFGDHLQGKLVVEIKQERLISSDQSSKTNAKTTLAPHKALLLVQGLTFTARTCTSRSVTSIKTRYSREVWRVNRRKRCQRMTQTGKMGFLTIFTSQCSHLVFNINRNHCILGMYRLQLVRCSHSKHSM